MDEEVQAVVNWLLGTHPAHRARTCTSSTQLDGSLPRRRARAARAGLPRQPPGPLGQRRRARRPSSAPSATCSTPSGATSSTGTCSTRGPGGCSPTWPTAAATSGAPRTPASGSCTTDRHYTISKMGCWVALDRAVRLAELGEIADRPRRPLGARGATRSSAWVDEHCWSEAKQRLHLLRRHRRPRRGHAAGRAHRLRPRRAAGRHGRARCAASSADGPLLYRYTGMDAEEGCFLACTFWLVDGAGRRSASSTRRAR